MPTPTEVESTAYHRDDLVATAHALGERGVLLVETESRCDTDLHIPGGITVVVRPGGGIVLADGVVLTLDGSLEAGRRHVFAGSGQVEKGPDSTLSEVYPEWFGAKGDGRADDSVAIQRAIDLLSSEELTGQGGTVSFASRKYSCHTSLTVAAWNIRLKGAGGKRGTVIICHGEDGVVFDGEKHAKGSVRYGGIHDMEIVGYASPNASGHGVLLHQAVENHFDNLVVVGFNSPEKYGIYFHGGFVNQLLHVTVSGCDAGAHLMGQAQTFVNCRFLGNAQNGVTDYGNASTFVGCDFEGNGGDGVNTSQNSAKSFFNCYWEGNGGAQLRCVQTYGLAVHGGRFFAGGGEPADSAIHLGAPTVHFPVGVSIHGAVFHAHEGKDYRTAAIRIEGAKDINVQGVWFDDNIANRVDTTGQGVLGSSSIVQGEGAAIDGDLEVGGGLRAADSLEGGALLRMQGRRILELTSNLGIGEGADNVYVRPKHNLALLTGGTDFGGGRGVVFVANVAQAPSSPPKDGGFLYVDDGALKFMGSSGAVQTLAGPGGDSP